MAPPYRVALVFDRRTVDEWRAYFLSAHRYAQAQTDWQIIHKAGYTCLSWDYALAQEPDGILASLEGDQPIPKVDPDRTRVVIVNSSVERHPFRRVVIDYVQAGRQAADHLIARGLNHFAYIGWSSVGYSTEVQQGFCQAVAEAGFGGNLHVVDLIHPEGDNFVPPDAWFAALPKPCGIACANDGLGVRMINACHAAGLKVPDEAAVMGIGDDEIQCVQSPIRLTSVVSDLFEQGHAAAQFLDRWLHDDRFDQQVQLYPSRGVVERQSTRMFGEPDPVVRRALVLIHTGRSTPMSVEQLVDQLGDVSRRRLEILFRQRLGRTPYQEIMRARLELTKRLLRTTALSIDEIAFRVGFSCGAHLSRPFKVHTGQTPSSYRQQFLCHSPLCQPMAGMK